MSRVVQLEIASLVTLMVLVAVQPARAVTVTLDGSTTLFSDGFEGGVVGTQPTTTLPGPGTWVVSVAGSTSNALIQGPGGSGPGAAAQGSQYLSFFRGPEPPASDITVRSTDWAQQPTTGTIHTEFWAWIPSNIGDFGFAFAIGDANLSQSLIALYAIAGSNRVLYHRTSGNDLMDLTYQYDTWQLWKLDWTLGSGQFTLSIDANSQSRSGIPDVGGIPIGRLQFSSSNFNQRYYIDGNPVPEPSTFVLLGVGLMGTCAWRLRRRKE